MTYITGYYSVILVSTNNSAVLQLLRKRTFIQSSWQSRSLSLVFPKQLDFQISLTCSLVFASLLGALTLWLIRWSFMYSLCCNYCSLVAFHVPFMFFGHGESEAKVEMYREKHKNTQGRCGTPSLIKAVQWPVPGVWCGFWITSITRGFVSAVLDWKYEWSLSQGRGEEKTRGALTEICRQTRGEKETSCQNFSL